NLAIADLASLGRIGDGLNGLLDLTVVDRDIEAQLGEEIHRIFGAAINLGVPLLTAISLDFRDGHPLHPDGHEGVANLFELEWFDDGGDQFHGWSRVEAIRATAKKLVGATGRPNAVLTLFGIKAKH